MKLIQVSKLVLIKIKKKYFIVKMIKITDEMHFSFVLYYKLYTKQTFLVFIYAQICIKLQYILTLCFPPSFWQFLITSS
jgi:hypothetical protein